MDGPGQRPRVGPSPFEPLVESPLYPQGCTAIVTPILASASSIRASMLAAAGVPFEVDPGRVDEGALKQAHDGDDAALATMLAEAKASETSQRHCETLVIGGDSVVSVDGRRFDKPATRDAAIEHLRFFSGKPMLLTSSVSLAIDGRIVWSHSDQAILHVRSLSDAFIHTYLDAEWPAVGHCVGVFRMEGRGVNLFTAIEGDHFTILGMPLLPLLGALRDRGVLAS